MKKLSLLAMCFALISGCLYAGEMRKAIDLFNCKIAFRVGQRYQVFKKLAEIGSPDAQAILGCYYQFHYKNDAEAEFWYRISAEQGNAIAAFNLASYLFFKSPNEAVSLLRKSAEQGLAEAQWNLALCYSGLAGVPSNNRHDAPESIYWFHKAAESGLPEAQYHLSILYVTGNGVQKNSTEAMKWRKLASEQLYIETLDLEARKSLEILESTGQLDLMLQPHFTPINYANPEKDIELFDGNHEMTNSSDLRTKVSSAWNSCTESEQAEVYYFKLLSHWGPNYPNFSEATNLQIAHVLGLFNRKGDEEFIAAIADSKNNEHIKELEAMYNAAMEMYGKMQKEPNSFSGIAKIREALR